MLKHRLYAVLNQPLFMARADNMENPHVGSCDFCGRIMEIHCIGDYWVCTPCRQKLEDEIEAISTLMEAEE